MIVAGFGCRVGATSAEFVAVLHAAEAACASRADAIAAPEFKRAEAGITQASTQLGLDLHWINEADLRAMAHLCPTQSEAALRETGHASVAEAAALAAAGPGAKLIQPRIAHPTATCAMAVSA